MVATYKGKIMIFKVFLVFPEPGEAYQLAERILDKPGYQVEIVRDEDAIAQRSQIEFPSVIILDEKISNEKAVGIIRSNPAIPVLCYCRQDSPQCARQALESGFRAVIPASVLPEVLFEKLDRAGEYQQNLQKWLISETRRNTRTLQKRVDDLERLRQISQQITSSLQLDQILREVAIAAVELTAAEEAQILLLDRESDDLILRSAFSREQGQSRILRLPVHDTLIGEVLENKKPVSLGGEELKKIQTAFLVRALIFVPMIIEGQSVGVLGVFNRHQNRSFSDYDRTLLEALADFAAIAVHNADLYQANEIEREKLETILNQIQDAVFVLDQENQLVLINHTAKIALNLSDNIPLDSSVKEIIPNQELKLILQQATTQPGKWREVHFDNGQIWACQVTPIEKVGQVVTLHEITYFKELDRQKTDFVNAVSHDLRSPLTAILGYTELIKRAGELNEKQQEYIQRIQRSVQGINALITDLLDLGRIESGTDTQKEALNPQPLVQKTVESISNLALEKGIGIQVEFQSPLPMISGNPIRIQQMIANLVGNAVKYTNRGGKAGIRAWNEQGQVIFQVWDTGVGIPLDEQAQIFDKFFRGSNLPEYESGTGLGLTIVKSIVDDLHGRIWVDSKVGEGTTFTVVLPSF